MGTAHVHSVSYARQRFYDEQSDVPYQVSLRIASERILTHVTRESQFILSG